MKGLFVSFGYFVVLYKCLTQRVWGSGFGSGFGLRAAGGPGIR